MLRTLPWIAVAVLWALWSLTVWALHALGLWALSSAGGLPGATGASPLSLPAWLPPEWAAWAGPLLQTLAPAIDGLLQAAPVLAGAWTVAAWLLWGVGSLLLVLLGGGLHLLIGVVRRSTAPPRTQQGPALQAPRPQRLQPPAGHG